MTRWYGSLSAPEIASRLTEDSIFCLPIGSYEQHGPHLPLHTDTLIAEEFTKRLIDQYRALYDLWLLPAVPYGLSLEHSWSPGTISMGLRVLASFLDSIVGGIIQATPARRLLIINGHGGNRGILEAATYELQATHQIKLCVLHPSALSTVRVDSTVPEVHAGMRETSLMLALAPADVRMDQLPESIAMDESDRDNINRLILNRGTTWPWTSDDPRIARMGITGDDPRLASAELGESIIASALDACRNVLETL